MEKWCENCELEIAFKLLEVDGRLGDGSFGAGSRIRGCADSRTSTKGPRRGEVPRVIMTKDEVHECR